MIPSCRLLHKTTPPLCCHTFLSFFKRASEDVQVGTTEGSGDYTCVSMHAAEVKAMPVPKKTELSVSSAINQCPGQPGREHFQTHLQQIMPAIPPSPRDRRGSPMNHWPFRRAAEWSSPCCVYTLLLSLAAKTAAKIGWKENGVMTPSWEIKWV